MLNLRHKLKIFKSKNNDSGKVNQTLRQLSDKQLSSETENTNPNDVLEGYKRLQAQLANHTKERTALKTILRHKIRPLADDVRKSLNGTSSDSKETVVRDMDALIKLVTATVNAMSI